MIKYITFDEGKEIPSELWDKLSPEIRAKIQAQNEIPSLEINLHESEEDFECIVCNRSLIEHLHNKNGVYQLCSYGWDDLKHRDSPYTYRLDIPEMKDDRNIE